MLSEKLLGQVRRNARARRRLRERTEEMKQAARAKRDAATRGSAALAQADGRAKHARAALQVAQEAMAEANEALALATFEELGLDPHLDDVAASVAVTLAQVGGRRRVQ